MFEQITLNFNATIFLSGKFQTNKTREKLSRAKSTKKTKISVSLLGKRPLYRKNKNHR